MTEQEEAKLAAINKTLRLASVMETNYEAHRRERLKDPEFRKEYDKLQPKYDLIAKRLRIREGIARIGVGGIDPLKNARPNKNGYKTADDIIAYLHSEDLMIPVEGELPECPYIKTRYPEIKAWGWSRNTLLDAGYKAVKPLIEEIKE